MTQSKNLHFRQLFTGDEWLTSGVTLEVDSSGAINAIVEGPKPDDAIQINGTALPGMPNLHSHAHQRAMAGLAEYRTGRDNFWTWRQVMYAQTRSMLPEDLQAIAAQAYVEMLKSGYTAVAEFQYLHHDPKGKPFDNKAEMTLRCLNAATETGIGITCLPVLYAYSGFDKAACNDGQKRFHNPLDAYLEIVQILEKDCDGNPNYNTGIAPHSLRAVDISLIKKLIESVPEGPVHIHIAEQTSEVEECRKAFGKNPVDWLLSNIEVTDRWCLIHATHMDDTELDKLIGTRAVAGLCPTTEANLGDGFFSARAFLEKGGCFGIGSDSQISINPVEELRWLEYAQRLLHKKRVVLGDNHSGEFLFNNALSGGAQACGRNIGSLKVGARADIVVLDHTHPRLIGRNQNQLIDSWIFSGNSNLVSQVFVGGEHVIKDGRHIREQEIGKRFAETILKLVDAHV